MSEAEEQQDLTPEELERQEAEQLPRREAMSVLYPPSPVGPIPLADFGDSDPPPFPPDSV
jgi:hypothetical protein